jgi:murein DD-endopeptidase MepM/ murein hydrolase activator NlpD
MISMPPNMFPTDQNVTLSLFGLDQATQNDYLDTTGVFEAGSPASQIIVVDTGFTPPQAEMSVSLKVPSGFPDAGYMPQLFVKYFWQDDSEILDFFDLPVASAFDPSTKEVTATIPLSGFTSLRNQEGTYECVLLLGSAPTVLPSQTSLSPESFADIRRDVQSSPCLTLLFAPLAGLNSDQVPFTSPFGLRPDPFHKNKTPEFHPGQDMADPASQQCGSIPKVVTNVVAAANGAVIQWGYNKTQGKYVIIRHPNPVPLADSYTLYGHLDSINLPPFTDPLTPGPPVKFSAGIPVTGGVTSIGTMGCTGRSTNRHLHFELGTALNTSGSGLSKKQERSTTMHYFGSTNANADTNTNGNTNGDGNTNGNTNGNTDTDTNTNGNLNSEANTNVYSGANADIFNGDLDWNMGPVYGCFWRRN